MDIINADNGVKIYPIETEDDIIGAFFGKMIGNYGLTGGGKTYVSNDIIDGLSKITPRGLFYSKTEGTNGNYAAMTGKSTIFTSFNMEKFNDDIEMQEGVCALWRNANEIDKLKDVADKVIPAQYLFDLNQTIDRLNRLDQNTEESKKKIEMTKRNLYKHHIMKHYNPKMALTDEEELIIKRMNTNPCLLIVVDDFAAEVSEYSKSKLKGQEFFRSLSFNCRHYRIV